MIGMLEDLPEEEMVKIFDKIFPKTAAQAKPIEEADNE